MEARGQAGSYRESLLAALGGLLTISENGQPTRELALGVQLAAALPLAAEGEVTSGSVGEHLACHVVESPDQMPNPFTDILVTARGHAVARCAFADDPVRNAELLIEAVLMAADAEQGGRIGARLGAGLALMNEVADRCAWQPYEASGGHFGQPAVPEDARLAQLARRVRLEPEDLERACGADWQQALAGQILTSTVEPSGNELEARPLVPSAGGGLIVARPDVLAPALAFSLSVTAAEDGLGEQLEEAFSLLTARRAFSSLAEMGPRHVRPAPKVDTGYPYGAAVYRLDADTRLHVLVLASDVEGGGAHTGQLWVPPAGPLLPAHLEAAEQAIREEEPGLETVIHLVVLEGGGAQPMLPLEREPDLASPCLVLTGSELEWLGRHPDVSGRDLLAFAHDVTDLRQRVSVAPVSQFDEFAAWRSEDAGLSALEAAAGGEFDRVVLSAGFGLSLRQEVLDRYAPHPVPAPDGDGVWRVARHLEYLDVDLWRPWGSPDWPPHLFVPGIGAGVWVLADEGDRDPHLDARQNDPHWDTRRKWTELIAYWLWRLRDDLPVLRAAAAGRAVPLVVLVGVDIDETLPVEEGGDEGSSIEVTVNGEGTVALVAGQGATDLLGGPDAKPEQELVLRVFRGLCESAGAHDADEPTFPEGLRKLVYMSSPDPAMRPVPVPVALIHPSYRARAYRRAGAAVVERLGIDQGPVEEGQVNSALHLGVATLFDDLLEEVEALDASRTVPLLLAVYERLLHARAVESTELVAIEEFFGHHEDAAEERRRRWHGLMGASVACRFLLEVAAARPPGGSRLPSDNRIQAMLATALTIVEYGRISDLVENRLTKDARVAVVPPGLLMATASDVLAAEKAFSVALHEGDIGRSAARRGEALDPDERTADEEEVEIDARIEAAYLVDHGYTVDDVATVLHALFDVPEHALGFTEIAASEALACARLALDDPGRAEAVLEALTLEQRPEFLKPPAPFDTPDVYPWRNNRPLSYLRKPLIATPAQDSEGRLVYGRGACFNALEFLLWLGSTGRLGAEGSALRDASIQLQHREARRLEDTVAELLEASGRWICRRRVKKLTGVEIERGKGEGLGDVDVLAANPELRLLICIEAKSLAGALAPRQLRNELDATFAPAGKKRSAAVKFIERARVVRANVAAALELLGVDGPPEDWRVGMAMISDPEVLSPLLDACPAPVISLEQLRASVAAETLPDRVAWLEAG